MSSAFDHLAPYACHPADTRGRIFPEDECNTRSAHQRDRDRIVHSAAFRRLEYKTQVFVNHEGDHYRTRLTHSLEVSQLARSMARFLSLNEDLAESLALAHDLGHPPFGHAGEDGLNEAMVEYGGFDHNAQSLQVLTQLEQRYADFDGLNLTWETLEGIAKHNGPVILDKERLVPRAQKIYAGLPDLELHTHSSLEAQLAAIADDIAYNNHDMEDGLRAKLFTLDDLAQLPMLDEIIKEVRSKYPSLGERRVSHEVIRRMINRMVNDIITTARKEIEMLRIDHVDAVRHAGKQLIYFSEEMELAHRAMKSFLFKHMYRHYKVNRMTSKAKRVVRELFTFFVEQPNCLPSEWYVLTDGARTQATAEIVCDFVAGMTDRFAMEEHTKIFDVYARS